MAEQTVRQQIRREFRRIGAARIEASLDGRFEPVADELVRVRFASAEWRLLPGEFEQPFKAVPDGAGNNAVKQIIEKRGHAVCPGPAPKDSRDTTHGAT